MSRYLILGSNSFCGSNFIAHLLKDGHKVVGISRSPEPDINFLPYYWGNKLTLKSFTFYQSDLDHHYSANNKDLH